MNDIDINKIIVSNELPFGKQAFKYSIGYKDSDLCIFHAQMIIYKKNFDENRQIYFKKENFSLNIWEF